MNNGLAFVVHFNSLRKFEFTANPSRVLQGTKLAPWLFFIMIYDLSISE